MNRTRPQSTDYETFLDPVLRLIREMRAAYRSKDITECDKAFNRLVALLQGSAVEEILDRELCRDVLRADIITPANDPGRLLETELDLSTRFGYDRKSADSHIARARRFVAHNASALVHIRTTSELVDWLSRLHLHVIEALRFDRFGRRKKIKRALKEADTTLYAVGSLVADGLALPAFSLSYTIAVSLLSDSKVPVVQPSGPLG